MLGMLIVIFGSHRIAGRGRVARKLDVFLGHVIGGAADLHVRAVRFVDPCERIVALAAALRLRPRIRCLLFCPFLMACLFANSSCAAFAAFRIIEVKSSVLANDPPRRHRAAGRVPQDRYRSDSSQPPAQLTPHSAGLIAVADAPSRSSAQCCRLHPIIFGISFVRLLRFALRFDLLMSTNARYGSMPVMLFCPASGASSGKPLPSEPRPGSVGSRIRADYLSGN